MEPAGGRELEAAGVIDIKFGAVTLLRHPGDADGARSCLGSIKRLDEPNLQISGWSCQGGARRAAIGCILNRPILLTAGNEPILAELFARAEFKRGSCAASATSAASGDWVSGAEPPAAWHNLIGSACQDAGFHATFFCRPVIIVMQCGPIDLVTACPRRLN